MRPLSGGERGRVGIYRNGDEVLILIDGAENSIILSQECLDQIGNAEYILVSFYADTKQMIMSRALCGTPGASKVHISERGEAFIRCKSLMNRIYGCMNLVDSCSLIGFFAGDGAIIFDLRRAESLSVMEPVKAW